jgi:hypothetical protein
MPERDRIADFLARGWCRFGFDPLLVSWTDAIRPAAQACIVAGENAQWQRCGGTWFVGVNALPNAPDGSVDGGSPLSGQAINFIRDDLGVRDFEWDRAQVSVVYAGYPQRMTSESEAAFRYRRERDAAHVDGVLPEGPSRRRFVRKYHRFILGIPLAGVGPASSPMVVWEGSHKLVQRTLLERFAGMQPAEWERDDITDLYREMRQQVFAACKRVEITAQPGEAWLVHRHALHGIAPWSGPVSARPRTIVYFRPEFRSPQAWLSET